MRSLIRTHNLHREDFSFLKCDIDDDWNSSVGIATRYCLNGRGIQPRWGQRFLYPSRSALEFTQPLIQWIPGLFPGDKLSGRGVNHSHPSRAEVKERVELYLYSHSGSSWPVSGQILLLGCNRDLKMRKTIYTKVT